MSKRPEFFRGLVLAAATALIFTNATLAQTATSRPPAGPPSVADLAEGLLDAVVNISISQNVKSDDDNAPMPQVPEGSPHQEFFDEFFRGQGGDPSGTCGIGALSSSLLT
ncbi:serine protease, partial [Sinorhizobium meliloti]